MKPTLLYRDKNIAVFHKPSGMHVHPHEDPQHRVSREMILLYQARDLLNQYVYPVHRLDAGTSGVIAMALTKDAAREMSELLQTQKVVKTYWTVVRGWLPAEGQWNVDLELDSTGEPVPAQTDFRRLAEMELPFTVRPPHPTSRYSWMEAHPRTGRFHQIRRHFARAAHPVLGDARHGDSKHNQFFRQKMQVAGLCLRAHRLRFQPSWLQEELDIQALPEAKWERIQELFALHPPAKSVVSAVISG